MTEPALKSAVVFHTYDVIAEGFAGKKELMDVVGTGKLQPPVELTTPAATSNSWNGIAIDPSETISRLKNRARVQSATTRILRLKVGTRDR